MMRFQLKFLLYALIISSFPVNTGFSKETKVRKEFYEKIKEQYGLPKAVYQEQNGQLILQGIPKPQSLPKAEPDLYKRAKSFHPVEHRKYIQQLDLLPNWLDGDRFWYRREKPTGWDYVLVDPDKKTTQPLFNHEELVKSLSIKTGGKVSFPELKLNNLRYNEKTQNIRFSFKGKPYRYSLPDKELYQDHSNPPRWKKYCSTAPNGKWCVFLKNYNLYRRLLPTGEEKPLTTNGSKEMPYAISIQSPRDLLNQKETLLKRKEKKKEKTYKSQKPYNNNPFPSGSWSQNGRYFVTFRMDLRDVTQLKMIKSNINRKDIPSFEISYLHPEAMDSHLATSHIVIFDVEKGKKVQIEKPVEAFYSLARPIWVKENVLVPVFDRGYKKYRLMVIQAKTGKTFPVYTETSDRFVSPYNSLSLISFGKQSSESTSSKTGWNYLSQLISQFNKGKPNRQSFGIVSDKTGWNHLYELILQFDKNGSIKPSAGLRQLTKGSWRFDKVLYIDPKRDFLLFSARHREKNGNPYAYKIYRLQLNKKNAEPKLLTPEPMNHWVFLSPDGKYFVDNISDVQTLPRFVLRETKQGKTLMELGQAKRKEGEKYEAPTVTPFEVLSKDGKEKFYGIFVKPPHFDPKKKYPVIEDIYTGPQKSTIPVTFSAIALNWNMFSLAELGAIIVRMDTRGMGGRSRAFLEPAYQNRGEVGLDEHIYVLKKLASMYPYFDLSHVGIDGISAGGYDVVRALTRRPDFYKVGVSTAGNHDARMHVAYWGELWFGNKDPSVYDRNTNFSTIKNLKGKLLLVHGESDDNVTVRETLELAKRLTQARKQFDMAIIPDQGHSFYSSKALRKLKWDFFMRYLLKQEPPEQKPAKSSTTKDKI